MRATVLVTTVLLTACIPGGQQHRPVAQIPADPEALRDPPEPAMPPAQPKAAAPVPGGVIPNAVTVRAQVYVVQPGDTLRGVGNRTGAGSEIIAKANHLAPPFVIKPGQKLVIPGGRYHLVEDGQTGLAIAQAYGVPWKTITALNAMSEPFVLRKGQRLLLPSLSTASPSLTLEQRAAAFRLDIDDALSGSSEAAADPADRPAPPPPRSKPASPAFSGSFGWPLNGRIILPFGPAKNGVRNNGIDIAAPSGTPVRAAATGTVTFASTSVSVFGGLVLIDHGAGWISAYGYVRDLNVGVGDKVARGTSIALTGDSGTGSQPRLHFEIRKDRKPINPVARMSKR
ncbi:M23 family metallopeptidase [Sphingobium subterraneum]|uniref:Murein DD-endopeptidase MepM/ murein hydrolase activator NlpD n=1 Tax=Sphingobium subterraneum TaxID=627688 RepID=A0A841J0S8_9SPHN|nr:M23 family metallopeptidase [Sphingobium subterraneum]MBB6123126.1 murein DD-endopeptidase MepM/ murein hydrolase activator NlpD [Sphingobium subterraneum]